MVRNSNAQWVVDYNMMIISWIVNVDFFQSQPISEYIHIWIANDADVDVFSYQTITCCSLLYTNAVIDLFHVTRELDCGVMASDVNSQLFSCIVSTISVLWQGFWDKVTNQFVAKHFILFFFHETDEDIFCQSLLHKVICSLTKLVPFHFHIRCTFPSMYDHIISGRCHQIPAYEKDHIFLFLNVSILLKIQKF